MILNPISYEKNDYKLLKIKPDSRLTKNSYEELINIFHSTYQPFINRLQNFKYTTFKNNGYFSIENNHPISYEVLFDGDNIKHSPTFYFGIPYTLDQYLKQRIQTTFPNSTLTFENDSLLKLIDAQFKDCYTYEFFYVKNNILSIKTGENRFFESLLTIKNSIQKGDCLMFQVELTPIGDYWKSFNEDKWNEIRNGKDVVNKVSKMDKIVNTTLSLTNQALDIFNLLLEDIVVDSSSANAKSIVTSNNIKLQDFSTASRQKSNYDGFKTSIRLYVSTNSKLKADNYSSMVNVALKEVEEDNRFQCKYNKRIKGIKRGDLKNKTNLLSTKELCTLINIPNQKIQRTFNIDSINIKQIDAPKECILKDGIKIGYMDYHGEVKNVYYPKDNDCLAMPKFYLCGMGGGKSNALLNYADDVVRLNQSLIDINYVDRCQLAHAIKSRYKNHIVLDLSDENNLPSFMLPEVKILSSDTPYQIKHKASNCANEVKYIINSITTNTEPITTRMSQYLSSACKLVFCYNNGKIKTVYDILDDENIRHEYIDRVITDGIFEKNDYEIRKLLELDDSKSLKKIEGILDRFCVLFESVTFQRMLESDDAKFNFTEIMDNHKTISICMPEHTFRNKEEKDIIITYLMSRIRLAMLDRENKDNVCHILLDEAHHLNKSLDVISNSIAEPRKFRVAFVFATHYFDQLGDKLKKASLNVGGHYILMKGVGEDAYKELKAKIGDEYDYEDIKAMEDFNSLNMIWIRGAYHMFITHLPNILCNEFGKKYI